MRIILAICFFLGAVSAQAQLEGRVIDEASGAPLPYTNVFVKGTSSGTVANRQGEFRLLVPTGADSVCFSYMGYETQCYSVGASPEQVFLKPQEQFLRELVVKPYDVLELLEKAISRIPENYAQAHTTTAFYRLITRKHQDYMHLSEVVMEQWHPGYAAERPGKRQIKMVKMRALMDEAASHGVELGMKPRSVLAFDLVSNLESINLLNKRGFKLHHFHLEGEALIDGRPTYVVTFDQKDKVKIAAYKGTIYIDKETLAFTRIKYGYSPKGLRWAKYGDAPTRAMLDVLGMYIGVRRANYDIYYQRQGDTYFMHKVLHNTWLQISSEREFYNFPVDAKVEYVVTSIDTASTEPFPQEEVTGNGRIFENQFSEYDSAFWADYNIILPDYEFREIARTIERSNAENDLKTQIGPVIFDLPKDPQLRIDSLLKFYHAQDRFNGAALIAMGREIIYENYFGLADKAAGIPVNAQTSFRIGSTAKTFTAALVMQQVNAGRLALEDSLGKFLPDHPHGQVTVHQLLTHTSGIPTYDKNPAHVARLAERAYSIDELVAAFTYDSLEFSPGKKFRYSNSGYLLLAAVLEKATGLSFGEQLDGLMKSAGFETGYNVLAMGYLYGDPEPYYPVVNTVGAGAMALTARDLLRWSLSVDEQLGPMLKPTISPHALYREWECDYGYGWMIDRYNFSASRRHKIVFHPGTDMGFRSMFVRQLGDQPSETYTVILLSNHGHFPRFDMVDLILEILN